MPLNEGKSSLNDLEDSVNKYHRQRPQRKIVKAGQIIDSTSIVNTEIQSFATNNDLEKQAFGLSHSNSSSSLDFWMEGEKMVSALCDISTESISMEHANTNQTYINTKRDKINMETRKQMLNVELNSIVPLQIVKLAVEACTAAENIAVANKNRPCFKNIQTICEKTKGNVQKPDSAVANLHSQGVPWVIKNFIFSFVRILDGWKIIKELIYEQHESFAKIENKYYDTNIKECFMEWQFVTKNMLDHIFKTFKAMDAGFQMEQQRFKQNCNLVNNSGLQNTKEQGKTITRPHMGNMSLNLNQNRPPWGNSNVISQGIANSLKQIDQIKMQANSVEDNNKLFNATSLKTPGNWLRTDVNTSHICKSSFTSNFSKIDGSNCLQNTKVGDFADMIKIPEHKFNIPTKTHNASCQFNNCLCSCTKYNCGDSTGTFDLSQIPIIPTNTELLNKLPLQNDNTINNFLPIMNSGEYEQNRFANIYMKPGSYNVLTKQYEPTVSGSVNTVTLLNSQVVDDIKPKNNFQYPIGTQPFSYLPPVNKICEQNEGFKMSDVTWEAAKQSAQRFLKTMHNNNELNRDNMNAENKYDDFENKLFKEVKELEAKTSQVENILLIDTKNDKRIEDKYFSVECDDAASSCSSKTCNSNTMPPQSGETLNKALYNVKRAQKKNSFVSQKGGKKKKQFVLNKLEDIVVTLRSMEMSYFNSPSMVISKMKNFHKVINKHLTFDEILDKILNSSYNDCERIIMDVRHVFYNAYAYLKIYSDGDFKVLIDKMSSYFESQCEEHIYNILYHEINKDKGCGRKHRKRIGFEVKYNVEDETQ